MIPFNKPWLTGHELAYMEQAQKNGVLAGDGVFTEMCHRWLETQTGATKALLTHSGTGALEMAALLADVQPGDEVIMPSYTFASTANAFVLRGAVPVFVDIRADTLNLDETLIEAAITPRTRAIAVVHFAGVACEMNTILEIARRHHLLVIEDAAQGVMSRYKGHVLGGIGDLGVYSFHETKNVISGEGGALLVNQPWFAERAEIIREKGTNRRQFFRGQVDKYTWCDVGSSWLPCDMIAAFLWAQLEQAVTITARRLAIWQRYHHAFESLEQKGLLRRPVIPADCDHNAHMYYLLLNSPEERSRVIQGLKEAGISAVFHYVPLHSSPMGLRSGHAHGELRVTTDLANRLLRLPLWLGLEDKQDFVIEQLTAQVHTSDLT